MTLTETAIEAVTLGRWQFGITTVYHFILVPLTIGLSFLVAIMQTIWYRTGNETWLKATRFFGKLLLINFALGVSTGIVQEFQFGMNWSEYSRYVGDIFGAPLAIEALLAFFLESTFLGLWIFGWGRMSNFLHLMSIWCVAIGTVFSSMWILAANSWMQHPVGAVFNPETGRAELDGINGFMQVVFHPVLFWEFTHVITSAWLTAGTFVAGISIWWMTRAAREGGEEGATQAREVWRPVARFGMLFILIGGLASATTGHFQGQEIGHLQPMKMAAAEGVCVDTKGAAFTVAQFGDCPLTGNDMPAKFIEIPGVTAFMEHNDFNAEVKGIQQEQVRMVELLNSNPDFVATYGDAAQYDFRPPQMPTFWSFRLMIGLGCFSILLALVGLWLTRKDAVPTDKRLGWFGLFNLPMPFLGISFGWIFTEMGRQPWVVFPNLEALAAKDPVGSVMMMTNLGVSTHVPAWQVATTMILFTVLYGVLGVIWFLLMRRYAVEGISSKKTPTKKKSAKATAEAASLSFGY
ncbi:MAG: cytochrome ubiquinol oxidase subunit I [Actinomycetaceae bacterium]|nr:cytochrome ubiquinol oxidase subunit I [Actinomycetaceae bacterium]